MRTIALIVLIAANAIPACAGISWQAGPSMPSARDHLGCGVVGGMFVVAGGAYWRDEQKHYLRETIAYSPKSGNWTRLPYLPEDGAYGASGVYKEELLIAGGANESGATSTSLRLTRRSGKYAWLHLPNLPRRIAGAGGAVVGTKFLVVSGAPGMDEAGIRSAFPTLFELDMTNPKAWKSSALPREFSPRTGAAVTAVGTRLFVFGGYGVMPDGTLGNFGDAWVMYRNQWKKLHDLPRPMRWSVALQLDSTHIGLFGGYGEGFLAQTLVYDVEKETYTQDTPLPLAVCNPSAGIIGRTILLAGGEDLQKHRSEKMFIGTEGSRN